MGIKGRIFIVGCPRSGTTLLQSLLATHPDIESFPESNLFLCLTTPGSRRAMFGVSAKGARKAYIKFLNEIGHPELKHLLPRHFIFVGQYARAFGKTLDILSLQQGKSRWIEKTPYHLRRVDTIEHHLQDPKFVHIVRNGEDVVASLYEVTHRHPKVWGGAKDIDQCLQEWIQDIQHSYLLSSRDNHMLVRYEQLLREPRITIRQVCNFIDVDYSDKLLEERGNVAARIIKSGEVWKGNISEPIRKSNSTKFSTLFSQGEQKYILDRVAEVNDIYCQR